MIENLRWDDFKIILAIADEKNLKKAASCLSFSFPTIYRRLYEIERKCGTRLFYRENNIYVATPAGLELVTSAREIEKQVLNAERRIYSAKNELSGRITITTTDTLMYGLLGEVTHRFRKIFDNIEISVIVSNEILSLDTRSADIAFRPVINPDESLIGNKMIGIEQAVYTSVSSACSDWTDDRIEWIAPGEAMHYPLMSKWFSNKNLYARCAMKSNSILMDLFMVSRHGYAAVLPTYLESKDAGIKRISPVIPELSTSMWGLVHTDLRFSPKVNKLLSYTRSYLEEKFKSSPL